MQRPRKHQPLPYRTGLDPRPLLAAVVCLPKERGEEPEPFYQEAEIQAAFHSASPSGIDQETHVDRNPNQHPNHGSSEAIRNVVYPCASPLSTTNLSSDLDSDQGGVLNSSSLDDSSEPALPAAEGLPSTSSPEIPPPTYSSVPAAQAAAASSIGIQASPPGLGTSTPSGDDPHGTGRTPAMSSVKKTDDEDGDREDDISTPEPKSSKKQVSASGTEGIGSEEMPNLVVK